jgi:hypothetical protein
MRKAKRAVALYRKGLTYEQVGARLEVSVSRVCQLLRLEDEPARKRRGGRPPAGGIPIGRRHERLRELWGELTPSEIAVALDCSLSTVTRDAHELGLDVAPPGRPRRNPDPPYVDKADFRRAVQAARDELAQLNGWLTVKRAAEDVLKLEQMALRQYHAAGRIAFYQLADVPELSHLVVSGIRYVVRRGDVERLRKELLAAVRKGEHAPPERLRTRAVRPYSENTNRRWDGKLAIETAAKTGKRAGPKPLVEPGNSDDEEIVRLYRANETQENIANTMGLTRKVVRGVLRRHGLAA